MESAVINAYNVALTIKTERGELKGDVVGLQLKMELCSDSFKKPWEDWIPVFQNDLKEEFGQEFSFSEAWCIARHVLVHWAQFKKKFDEELRPDTISTSTPSPKKSRKKK